MNRGFVYMIAMILAAFAFGQDTVDTINVRFRVNQSIIDPKLSANATALDSLTSLIYSAAVADNLSHITIEAYASPEGPYKLNERLALRRCNAVANYITSKTGIDRDLIQTHPGGIAWVGLRDLVEQTPETPMRSEVLNILAKLSNDGNEATIAENQQSVLRELSLLNGGVPYRWMLRNLFPRLRHALAIIVYSKPQGSDRIVAKTYTLNSSSLLAALNGIPHPAVDTTLSPISPRLPLQLTDRPKPHHRLALKTNLLYYGALMPNIELEWLIKKHWSVLANWDIAWWGKYANNKSYRLSIIETEGRYWIAPRAPWHGLFTGIFAGGGWYDLLRNEPGYYGEGLMTGVSVGYMWPIARNWSMEAAIGAGYAYTRCKEYKPYEGHHLYQRTKDINYFGPLKAKISIAWRFWDKKKTKPTAPAL